MSARVPPRPWLQPEEAARPRAQGALPRGPLGWALPRAVGSALGAALAATAWSGPADADALQGAGNEVVILGATPLPGAGLDAARAPYEVRTVSASDLERSAEPSVAGALSSRLGAVSVNETLDDPFQPDILYRGFEASPVLGVAQGLAVYQNGVRINEAFGDTVNWDLIPSDAIARIDVVGSNPVYGQNALGGAVVVAMKTGFDHEGAAAEVSLGAFGRRAASAAYGARSDHMAVFVTGRAVDEDGWRLFSKDRVRQLYAAISARGERLTLDLTYAGADNGLSGEGAAPVQELAVSRRLVFTAPQRIANHVDFAALNSAAQATSRLAVDVNLYVRAFRQESVNGDTTQDQPCAQTADLGLLCAADAATPLHVANGALVPDISQAGALPIGQTDRQGLRTLSYGGAVQASSTTDLLGRPNRLAAGLSLDRSGTVFTSGAEVGVIAPDLLVEPSGLFVSTPEGGAFTATPVRLHANVSDLGVFATDTFDLTRRLSVTGSARWSLVRIALLDGLGARLSGAAVFSRVNPALGATYQVGHGVSLYGGYAEGSRAPTPSEIECSDPSAPCLLPSSLSADPPRLRQVVSSTVEAGVRGSAGWLGGRLVFSVGAYDTRVLHDIYAVADSLSAGYFQNVGGTRRLGGALDLSYRDDRVSLYASYAHVAAVFASDLVLPSPSNPSRDVNGDIHVRRGDSLPGIPRDRLKLGGEAVLSPSLRAGADLQAFSGQIYRGDEANQLRPLPGYVTLGLSLTYAPSPRLRLFARAENALNARYATFGVLGDPTGVGAPGVPPGGGADSRFQSPAAPASVLAGAALTF